MRWSATRVRWLLLGGAVLLVVVVAGFFGVARYRAGVVWQRILARNGVNLHRDTNGITWSQSSKGRTIFTLHASKATPEGHNRWALHDAVLILYGHEPGQDDRIYGSEFHYDEEAGVARAVGEVHMDLRVPQSHATGKVPTPAPSLGFGVGEESASDPNVIHVRTSGLTYLRKVGLAATGETTEFRYGGITCISRGAEFDSAHSLLRLLADVRLMGQLHGSAFTVTSAHAELDRDANTVNLASPVLTETDRVARAEKALLHLRKDGSLQAADANGSVELRSPAERLAAPQLQAVFGANNQPQTAHLGNGVTFTGTDATRPAQGTARTVDLQWNGSGQLTTATGNGAVSFARTERDHAGSPVQRHLRAETVEAQFTSAAGSARDAHPRPQLRHAHLLGAAELGSSSPGAQPAAPRAATLIAADELDADFAGTGSTGRVYAQTLHGEGHTRLDQLADTGAHQISTAEALAVTFLPPASGAQAAAGSEGQGSIQSARQTGHVEIQSWAAPKADGKAPERSTAHATTAVYTGAAQALELTGDADAQASLQQPGGSLLGHRITLHQGTGDIDADGTVQATSLPTGGAAATHVLAERANLLHATSVSRFLGEPGRPVQLWQGGSQVQAGEIILDGHAHELSARPGNSGGLVRAVFATSPDKPGRKDHPPATNPKPAAPKAKSAPASSFGQAGREGVVGDKVPEAERNSIAVSASRLDFDQARREAVFAGGVRMEGGLGDVTGERAVAFLRPAAPGSLAAPVSASQASAAAPGALAQPDLSGNLDRLVVLGDVHITQPGREGTGEQLTYTAATDSFALTGTAAKPPRVTAEQGSVLTGATLLFRGADSTIVVAGAKGEGKAAASGRVHTETDLKP